MSSSKHTPDRVWLDNELYEGRWHEGDAPTSYPHVLGEYLLSTPARENAEELLEALEKAVEQLKSYGADGCASGADAAIAKAKGEG